MFSTSMRLKEYTCRMLTLEGNTNITCYVNPTNFLPPPTSQEFNHYTLCTPHQFTITCLLLTLGGNSWGTTHAVCSRWGVIQSLHVMYRIIGELHASAVVGGKCFWGLKFKTDTVVYKKLVESLTNMHVALAQGFYFHKKL